MNKNIVHGAGHEAGAGSLPSSSSSSSSSFGAHPQLPSIGSGNIKLPLLQTGTDYYPWRKAMRSFLQYHEALSAVEDPAFLMRGTSVIGALDPDAETIASRDDEVQINNSTTTLTPQQTKLAQAVYMWLYSAILKCSEAVAVVNDVPEGNAYELWKRLEEHYQQTSAANINHLLGQFHNFRMKNNESIALYVSRFRQVLMQLTTAGEPMPTQQIMYKLIDGLDGNKYADEKKHLDSERHFRPECCTFEKVVSYLREVEGRRIAETERRGKPQKEKEANFSGSQGAANNRGGRFQRKQQRGGGGGGGLCYTCHQPGHQAHNCPKKQPRAPKFAGKGFNNRTPKANNGLVCDYCGADGHEAQTCFIKKRAEERRRPASAAMAAQSSGSAALSSSGGASASAASHCGAKSGAKPVISLGAHVAHGVVGANLVSTGTACLQREAMEASYFDSVQPEPKSLNRWYLDSGAASHNAMAGVPMVNAAKNEDITIRVASGELLHAPEEGEVYLQTPMADGPVKLHGVLSHSGMGVNLLSVATTCLCPSVAGVWFDRHGAQVLSTKGRVLVSAKLENNLYVVDECQYDGNSAAVVDGDKFRASFAASAMVAEAVKQEQVELWHTRLAHMGHSSMKKLVAAKVVDDLNLHQFDPSHSPNCEGCMRAKLQRAPLGKGELPDHIKPQEPMDRWDADLFGPFKKSLGGKQWLILIKDRKGVLFAATLKAKSDATEFIIRCHQRAKNLFGRALKEFHTDGGGEFTSDELKEYWLSEGTLHTITMADTPQHNGAVEREGGTIMAAMAAMLKHAGAPVELWGEAAITAVHVRNMASIRAGEKNTPNQIWHKYQTKSEIVSTKESVKHLRVFGCDAWVHIPDNYRVKLDDRGHKCIFIGYDESGVGYRFFDVTTGRIIRSRDAIFEERSFTQCAELKRQLNMDVDGVPLSTGSRKEFDGDLDDLFDENELNLVKIISATEHANANQPEDDDAGLVEGVNSGGADQVPPIPLQSIESDLYQHAVNRDSGGDDEFKSTVQHTSVADPLEAVLDGIDDDGDSDYEPSESEVTSSDSPPAPTANVERRYPQRDRKPTNFYGKASWGDIGSFLAEMVEAQHEWHHEVERAKIMEPEPLTLYNAMNSPERKQWEEAIEAEDQAMIKNRVMVEVDRLPPGMKAIPTKYVFKRKIGVDGKVSRYKARMVVQGFRQREGIDYHDTFAPTLYHATLRVLLAIVCHYDYDLTQMDVETAFLNAPLKEDVYITLPKGSINATTREGRLRLFKLLRALYGLKQAPLEWNEEFNGTLTIKCKFKRCMTDACLYVKMSRTGRPMFFAIFVDDMLCANHPADRKEMEEIKNTIKQTYSVKDLGDASLVLGMRIRRDRVKRVLTLDQEQYIVKMLERFNMSNCVPVSTPEVPCVKLTSEGYTLTGNKAVLLYHALTKKVDDVKTELQSKEIDDATTLKDRYGSAVGSLLYAAICTRPDIQHAVSRLGSYVSNPHPSHWHACERVLRYLRGTLSLGLTFRGGEEHAVTLGPAFADANWGGDIDDAKSTTGYLIKINGCAVAWKSKKQQTVACSSAEAEYMAMSDCTNELLWLRQLLEEMKLPQPEPTLMYCDNQAAIITATQGTQHQRMKHIAIKYHHIREHIGINTQLQWIKTEKQQADILTKGLGRSVFVPLRCRMMGESGLADME